MSERWRFALSVEHPMTSFDRRAVVFGAAASALATGANAQITVSKQFKAGPTAPLAQTQADPNLAKFFNNRPGPINGPSPDGQSTFYAPAGMSVNTIAGDSRLPAGFGAMSIVSAMMTLASGAAKAAQGGLVVMM